MSKLGGDKSPFPIPSGAPKKKPSRPWKTKANSTVVTSTYVKVSKSRKQIFLLSYEPKTKPISKLFIDFCRNLKKWIKSKK